MVSALPPNSDAYDENYDRLQESWPAERPSRKRRRREQRPQRRIVVKATRRAEPDAAHMSKALLAAQRELERRQAEADAQQTAEGSAS